MAKHTTTRQVPDAFAAVLYPNRGPDYLYLVTGGKDLPGAFGGTGWMASTSIDGELPGPSIRVRAVSIHEIGDGVSRYTCGNVSVDVESSLGYHTAFEMIHALVYICERSEMPMSGICKTVVSSEGDLSQRRV